jgi:hypothetical protein
MTMNTRPSSTPREATGRWESDPDSIESDTCVPPGVGFSDVMQIGNDYRISATARMRKSSAAPTRKVQVKTWFFEAP